MRLPLVCYDHMMFFITFNLILFFWQGYIIQPGATSRKISLKIPKGNQNLYIEEEQATQWPKEKVQKDKKRSTKHTHKTKDRVTRTPLKTGGELRCSGRVSSSCSTGGTHGVTLVTNPLISPWMRKGPMVDLLSNIVLLYFYRHYRL